MSENTDTFKHDPDHERRCNWPSGMGAHMVARCPVCKGKGKVYGTFGNCTECGGSSEIMVCLPHRVYWKP